MTHRRRWLWPLALIATMALVLAACPQDEAAVEDDEAPEPTAEVDLAQSCENAEWGYTIGYPEGWVTNEEDDVLPACSAFDPDEVTIDLHGDRPIEATIFLNRAPQAYERLIAERPDRDEISREDATVDGYDATVLSWEATGQSVQYEPGTQVYAYFIDVDGATLVATAAVTEGGPISFDDAQDALDAMMASLEIHDAELVEPDDEVDDEAETDDDTDDTTDDETDDEDGDDEDEDA